MEFYIISLNIILPTLLLISISYRPTTCYKSYKALDNIVFTEIDSAEADVHSEYYYGKCANPYKVLYKRDHWIYEQLKGKMLVKGNISEGIINEAKISCIYIRAKSPYGDIVRYHPFKFNVCIYRILYNYAGSMFSDVDYEWYLPVEMLKDIAWDLYFYRDP